MQTGGELSKFLKLRSVGKNYNKHRLWQMTINNSDSKELSGISGELKSFTISLFHYYINKEWRLNKNLKYESVRFSIY